MTIAPFHVIIIPVNVKDQGIARAGEDLYRELEEAGIEVLLDDRDERAGVKFNDADLIGIPVRVTIGPKSLAAGNAGDPDAQNGRNEDDPRQGATTLIKDLVKGELKALNDPNNGHPR